MAHVRAGREEHGVWWREKGGGRSPETLRSVVLCVTHSAYLVAEVTWFEVTDGGFRSLLLHVPIGQVT